METDKLRIATSRVKCTMKSTTQKGKKYKYPQYSLTLKKPYVFSKDDKVVVLLEEEVNKLFGIDKVSELVEGIDNLTSNKGKVKELQVEIDELKTTHEVKVKELQDTHSTQLGNLTQDKIKVETDLKHMKERLQKEHRDLQELEGILNQYSKANILSIWINRRVKRLPLITRKTTAEDEEKGE